MNCNKCNRDISGPREAYGGLSETLCYSCWYDPERIKGLHGPTVEEQQALFIRVDKRISGEIDAHRRSIEDLEWEISELRSQIRGHKDDIQALNREFEEAYPQETLAA